MSSASQPSLERRLPVMIGVLLMLVVGSLSWFAQRELERALLASVQQRLEGARNLLTDVLSSSFSQRQTALRTVTARAELVDAVRAPADSTLRVASDVLVRIAESSSSVRAIELWGANGECLARVARPAPAEPLVLPAGGGPLPRDCHADEQTVALGGVGPLRNSGSDVVYDLAVSVADSSGTGPVGKLVEVRFLRDAQSVALIEGLIGSDAHIYVGSNKGDVWSNLKGPVPGPPVDSTSNGLVHYTDEAGVELLGVAGPLSSAPWLIWVQFPESVVLAPQQTFLQRAGVAMLVILLLGSIGAWIVGRGIARPLRRVTEAAEEIANGQYSSRVVRSSADETGRLASAFNSMAERIETDHRELENRVAARTKELQGAMVQLQDAQEQLVRREKLAMLGQLASGVGHELRNPLGVMSNAIYYLELVMEDARYDVKEYLGIIKGQIGLSEKIVGDLLDFARIRPPQKDTITLERLVEDQLARLSAPSNVRVVREFPHELPAVHVDKVQIGQVVLNLLTNAFQAMEDGSGTLTLRGVEVEPGRARLEVIDTGVGISDHDMAKIFEPLYTTKARGIGLGLAVARSLAEANAGALTADSRKGEGARFSLVLPTRKREAA